MDVRLTDEGMERIRASEPFAGLSPDEAAELQEYLYTAFSGGNAVPARQTKARLGRYLDEALADPGPVRRVILDALEPI